VRIDPIVQRPLPVFNCAFCNWSTFTGSEAFKPVFRLLSEREHSRGFLLDHLVEMFDRVRTALRDDFAAMTFAFRFGQKAWTRDRAHALSHEFPCFLPGNIHPVSDDIPLTTFLDVTFLPSAAGHALSPPLHGRRW
jgi:hypothetical protein